MKKFFAVLLICVLVNGMCISVYADADAWDIIAGKQDILLFATVEGFDNGKIVLDPYGIMTPDGWEKYNSGYITVDSFLYFTGPNSPTKPLKGENVIISLNKSDSGYKMANGAYRVQDLDYKLLRVYVSENVDNQEWIAQIIALVKYLHSNGTVKDFSYKDGILTSTINGNTEQLYPTDAIFNYIRFINSKGEFVDSIVTKDIIKGGNLDENAYVVNKAADIRWMFALGIIFIGIIVGGFFAYKSAIKDVVITRRRRR